jgi:DNA repair protein RadD
MLRPYQQQIISDVKAGWQRHRNILMVLPTGAGKTLTAAHIIKDAAVPTAVIAHRQELVSQLSLALAQQGIPHRLICSDDVLHQIVRAQRVATGKVWFDPTAPTFVAGVDTLIKRKGDPSFNKVRMWIQDEAHHCVYGENPNKWGRATDLFPNAYGLGVTATPIRADGKGLGRHHDGVFDTMIEGPTGQQLIDMGYLSPFEIAVCKPEDLDFSHVEHGADGDFKQGQLRTATKASRMLVGSIVGEYLRRAKGRLGITFAVDIEDAERVTAEYNESGVPAALVTGTSSIMERVTTLEKFRRRQILQLVNVDLFGEGVDVPGVEVVSMARRTDSFSLYSQQFGRSLRPVYREGMPLDTDEQRRAAIAAGPKPKALILDHVGNVIVHRLPTSRRKWSLDRRERKSRAVELDNEDKLKACLNPPCGKPYPAMYVACPFCGHEPKVTKAKSPLFVDGDLMLLDDVVLAEMNRESERIMGMPQVPKGLPLAANLAIIKKHGERTKAQTELREAIAAWGGVQTHLKGISVREAQKLFFLTFGVDVMTAQTLGTREAMELKEKVAQHES